MSSATGKPCPDGQPPNASNMGAYDYTWLFVVGLLQAFIDGYGVGANDVANSFATSVASKTITLRTACLIATFAELLGAVLLGKSTAETVRNNILILDNFKSQPEVLMLGMWCALIGSSSWILLATYHGMPVSTTHSIVGAIIGVGIATFGTSSVYWGWDGVSKIVASWFTSPAVAGILASLIYLAIKYGVMLARNPFETGLLTLPIFFFVTVGVNLFFILLKGVGSLPQPSDMPRGQQIGFFVGVFVAALSCALFAWCCYAPWLRRVLLDEEDLKIWHIPITPFVGKQPPRKSALTPWGGERMRAERAAAFAMDDRDKLESAEVSRSAVPETVWDSMAQRRTVWGKAAAVFVHGTEVEVANHDADRYQDLHDEAVRYDSRAEVCF
ncbi:hypothetical protein HDU93_009343 [Gonapodya sp. JEL0774]|nr:hypothetical protein HDU93_009343 [Gonapodya sp. JEL0774]